jgi:hypothetical protein
VAFRLKPVLLGCVAILASLVLFAYALNWVIMGPEGRKFDREFRRVEAGMARQEVVQRLGEPDDQGKSFRLSQEEGFEREYARARASHSKYYFFWEQNGDVTYAVGFDAQDKVTLKSVGGT